MDEHDETICIRPSEAARRLSISKSSIYNLIAAGKIPSCKIGNMIRIPVAALRRVVEDPEAKE
jgi:excisionase family DNA binding protein